MANKLNTRILTLSRGMNVYLEREKEITNFANNNTRVTAKKVIEIKKRLSFSQIDMDKSVSATGNNARKIAKITNIDIKYVFSCL